jgi:hypothetical protein
LFATPADKAFSFTIIEIMSIGSPAFEPSAVSQLVGISISRAGQRLAGADFARNSIQKEKWNHE